MVMTEPRFRLPRLDRPTFTAWWRGWTGVLSFAGVAYALVYVGLFLVRPAGDPGATILSDFGEVPLDVLGVTLALAVVAREPRRKARLAWSLPGSLWTRPRAAEEALPMRSRDAPAG